MSRVYQVSEVLALLDGVRRTGNGWTARCPAHDDRSPSLSVGIGRGSQILFCCHAGCTTQAVLDRLGLTWAELFPKQKRRGGFA